MPYITVVPAIRTIPGVEEFDYAIFSDAAVNIGDLIRVPFRKRELPALVIKKSESSPVASKTIQLGNPKILLHLDPSIVHVVTQAARHSFNSLPTVFASWIKHVPKRIPESSPGAPPSQRRMAESASHFLINRWQGEDGIVSVVKKSTGKILILTAWQEQANQLGEILLANVLHADIPMQTAWRSIQGFVDGTYPILVTTRSGAWLATQADVVCIDEPENDDFKQDELSPRLDARWIVDCASRHRFDLSVHAFSTTPRFDQNADSLMRIPDIPLELSCEPWQKGAKSSISSVSGSAIQLMTEALNDGKQAIILHPIRGERARIVCRDCHWTAPCPSCGFGLSLTPPMALCRRCGKKTPPPHACAVCGGYDLSASRPGADRLKRELDEFFPQQPIQLVDATQFQHLHLPPKCFVICTDIGLLAGAVEDIRRKERFIITWRRLAGKIAQAGGSCIIQGPPDLVDECRELLTPQGVKRAWERELADRRSFGYPPAVQLIKILVDGEESIATGLSEDLRHHFLAPFELRGPFPVEYRAATRDARWVIHLVCRQPIDEETLIKQLDPWKKRAIIDLEPLGFFT